jgi:NAD(P)H-flavin reductase
MAKPTIAVVEGRAEPTPGSVLLWLHCPALAVAARPGQFVMLRAGPGLDPYLRLPLPIHRLAEEGLALYATTADAAYPYLADLGLGARLDLLGPFGREVLAPYAGANLALVGQGQAIAPLLALLDGDWGAAQLVTTVATERQAYPAALLPANVAHASFAGRRGEGAFWATVEEAARWAGAIYLSGTPAFYRQARGVIERARIVTPPGLAQAWIWRDLACGAGHCGACLTPTRRGPRRVCSEGPFLDLADLVID